MSRVVQIHGDRATFPLNACVECFRPATHEVEIEKVKGQQVRRLGVPFCDECAAVRQAKSSRQTLFERAATANSVLLSLAVGACVYRFLSFGPAAHSARGWAWSLLIGVLAAEIVFGTMYLVIRPWALRFRSPESKAMLKAVTIVEFDWETTTLEFSNEEYGEQFARANRVWGGKAENDAASSVAGTV